jgi:sugar phosphate isomerase/epimerase
MSYNRRKFLKATGLAASGLLVGAQASKVFAASGLDNDTEAFKKIKKFGLQLYSLRADLPKDPKGVLKQVASFGYKQVESFVGNQGMFWGMSNTEFKKYMDDLGMTIVSSHCPMGGDFDKKAALAGEIGMKYLICPYIGPQKTLDDYKIMADKFNVHGDICKKNGLRFAYHNHGYTFKPINDVMPQDVLMRNTNADTVDFQMDMYWVVTPGEDPVAWLNKYPNRFRLCHVKDRTRGASGDDASCDLGTGSIDYPAILKVAAQKGMQYYIVEQEKYEGSTPLKSAEADAVYMKKLKI